MRKISSGQKKSKLWALKKAAPIFQPKRLISCLPGIFVLAWAQLLIPVFPNRITIRDKSGSTCTNTTEIEAREGQGHVEKG
jgi:hypothetical protein